MKQRGRNEKYPDEIKTWRLGEPVPSWLSDVARVKEIKDDGSVVIDLRIADNDNGFEIIDPENRILVKTKSNSDFICYGDRKIFTINENQLNLLYYD